MKKLFIFSIPIVFSLFIISCSNDTLEKQQTKQIEAEVDDVSKGQSGVREDPNSPPNALDIAISSPDHTTLVAAVQAAELENALVNAGPLTVFAPTNEAFAKLPEGTVETLVKPENRATLTHILEGHVSPGNYKREWMKDGMQMYMANGEYYNVEIKDGEYYVGGAMIIATIPVSNGIVHVVDAVILPPAK
jgi:uncharacterized surface protein with fasciclin (FAS1) repeats